MRLSRRDFIRASTAVVGLGALRAGTIWGADGSILGSVPVAGTAPTLGGGGPVLVVLQLSGGNDGLNTLIPWSDGKYFDYRPNLGIREKDTLPLTGGLGLNPGLKAIRPMFDAGQVAVVQNVGYPQPNRSHFRSMEIWQTAQPQGTSPVGWLGRLADITAAPGDSPLRAVAIGDHVPRAMVGSKVAVPSVESVAAFAVQAPDRPTGNKGRFLQAMNRMYTAGGWDSATYAVVRQRGTNTFAAAEALATVAGSYQPALKYPGTGLGRQLQLVANILAGGFGSRLFWVTQNGFDEHSGEKNGHVRLMTEFADAMAAFYQDLAAHNLDRQVVTLAYSEFGRRVKENASQGTDHGTAGPVFLFGSGVSGGVYGSNPDLSRLDGNGDLIYQTDFRAVYATLLDRWVGVPARDVLGQGFEDLGFIRPA